MRTLNNSETNQVSGGVVIYNVLTGTVGLTNPNDSFAFMTDEKGNNGSLFLRENNYVVRYPVIDNDVQTGILHSIITSNAS